MIRSRRGLIILGVVVFVTGLVAAFPARVAVAWFTTPSELAISGIHGTAWHGSAQEAHVQGVYLHSISWRLNPLRLFTGKLSYQVAAKPATGFIDARINIGLGGTLELSALTAAVPLQSIAPIIDTQLPLASFLQLRGNVSLNFERIEFAGNLATVADGVAQIEYLIVPPLVDGSLGGYKAEFSTQNNGIVASLEDTDGVVDLAGSMQVRSDRTVDVLARLVAKPEAPKPVAQWIRSLPPVNSAGQKEWRWSGVVE